MKRLLVTGGRDYSDVQAVNAALNAFREKYGISVLISGGAKGADEAAELWAFHNGIAVDRYPVTKAAWKVFGRAAGPRRNARMLEEGKPDIVLAFPGGNGTRDMTLQAKAAGLTVLTPEDLK